MSGSGVVLVSPAGRAGPEVRGRFNTMMAAAISTEGGGSQPSKSPSPAASPVPQGSPAASPQPQVAQPRVLPAPLASPTGVSPGWYTSWEQEAMAAKGRSWAALISPTSSHADPASFNFHMDGRSSPSHSDVEESTDDEPARDKDVKDSDPGERFRLHGRRPWSRYPTSPMFNKTQPQAEGRHPRIGIDIGGVLTRDGDPSYMGSMEEWDSTWEAPGAFDAVKKIVQVFQPENVFIVSKVRPNGSMHRRMEQWLHETLDFCSITGIPKDHIIFVRCVDGPDGKGVAALQLGLSHFVDDKVEVLKSLWEDEAGNVQHLIERHQGKLFHFNKGGWQGSAPHVDMSELSPRMQWYYHGVPNWAGVLKELREGLPHCLAHGKDILVPADLSKPAAVLYNPNSSAARAAKELPPWARKQVVAVPASPTANRASSATVAPVRTAAALQRTADGRPKLVLKPRQDPAAAAQPVLAAPAAAAPVVPAPVVNAAAAPVPAQPPSPTANRAASAAASQRPKAALQWADGRPKLMLKPKQEASDAHEAAAAAPGPAAPAAAPQPQAAPVIHQQPQPQVAFVQMQQVQVPASRVVAAAPVTAAPVAQVAAAPAPAQRCAAPATITLSASGRPKLNLKPRGAAQAEAEAASNLVAAPVPAPVPAPVAPAPVPAPAPVAPAPAPVAEKAAAHAGSALQPDPSGGRPRLVLKKREEVAPAPQQQEHAPAMQRDPAGGRPRLILKPRTAPNP